MKLFRFLGSATAGALAALLISGCGNGNQSGAGSSQSSTSSSAGTNFPLPDPPLVAPCPPGVLGGRLVISAFGDPKTFNPITAAETSSTDIIGFLFASLLNVDAPTQTVLPGLAESWSVAPDQKTWTFHLRKGLRWSDGAPLTADDVVFTWNVIYNPKIINVTVDLFRINGKDFTVSKLDDYTVQVVTPEIYAPFELFFGGVPIIPRHILEPSVTNRFEAAYGINTPPEQLVGSGPFRLKEYKPGQYTMLERNPYFMEVDTNGQRLPYIDNVLFEVVPDQNAISLRFLSGGADVQELVRPEEFPDYKRKADSGQFQLMDLGLASEHDMLTFNENTNVNTNTGKPFVDPIKLKWFRNTKFRQAISYAIDRETIVKVALGGRGAPNYGFVPVEQKKWYNPDIAKYSYDPAKARGLLAEIGITNRGDGTLVDDGGHPIAFVMYSNAGNDRRAKTAVVIQQNLKDLGIDLTFQPLEFNNLIEKSTETFDFDCILLGWAGGSPDPAGLMDVFLSSGFDHDWFPRETSPSTPWEARIDELMYDQLKTLDQAERKKDYDEVQAIMAEEMPTIPTVSMEAYSAVNSKLRNVRGTTLSSNRILWNAEQLYFAK